MYENILVENWEGRDNGEPSKNMLLIEHWSTEYRTDTNLTEKNESGVPNKECYLIESVDDKGTGNLYIEGIFLQAEVPNGNGRIYPKRVMEKAVERYIKDQVASKQSLGELNHPGDRSYPDPSKSALVIEKLWWKGNDVYGRARIVEGDHAEGDKVAALIRAGWIPGVSSRGLGSLKRNSRGLNEVQEGYRLTVGVDVVWGPSAPNAYTNAYRVNESKTDQKPTLNNTDDAKILKLIEALKS
ncbi:prohead core scaffold protein and protease [Aeromonas phage AS-yj]|uniref:Prohead core scaffold proteinand protease n=6 Tax=Caudoviricetes TaxID=2731619 RepID=A0A291LDF8_9CAUD|nr:prohead core scaffold protein and protease [Aeromonas phage AS-zj]YP_009834918.1 prohead core scaffold protein and protease [Aeromonas phage AS-sw]ATI17427.1 prohead core scaffold proteinand protease [Aeromonas phage AS-szw]ATI17667.1 prohead core scaffold protein and protease [Aeromonas phage AS-yj]QAX97867.1 prohead core scaffold protein and protease [Aeromonas phage Asswx_1]QAX99082.1 prohead core scaffold protein and protease [Aeromonas phage Assk]QMV28784.1 prohead core scaffold prote